MSLDLVSDLCVSQGHPVVSSLKVAERFGKRHDDVLRAIRNLTKGLCEEYRLRNFAETVYLRPNPSGGAPIESPCFNLTRDGFCLLAMRFTGKEALEWQVRFLEAFNAMEKALLEGYTRKAPETAVISTVADRQPLHNLINVWARLGCIHHRDAFAMVAARYSLPTYTLLPTAWLQDAIDWVQSQIDDVQSRRLTSASAPESLEKMLRDARAEGVMDVAQALNKLPVTPKPAAPRPVPDEHALKAMSALIVTVVTLLSGFNASTADLHTAVSSILKKGVPDRAAVSV